MVFKGHMAAPGQMMQRGQPGSGIAGFFINPVEQFDSMIGEHESKVEVELEVARDRLR